MWFIPSHSTGPFCIIVKDSGQNKDNICTYSLNYPFRGSAVAEFQICESILREYINLTLPKNHFGTHAYFSVSLASGETELRAIRDLNKFHLIYLSYEPIAFLHGIRVDNGVVISVNQTMIEISVIKYLTIQKFILKYISEYYRNHQWSMTM